MMKEVNEEDVSQTTHQSLTELHYTNYSLKRVATISIASKGQPISMIDSNRRRRQRHHRFCGMRTLPCLFVLWASFTNSILPPNTSGISSASPIEDNYAFTEIEWDQFDIEEVAAIRSSERRGNRRLLQRALQGKGGKDPKGMPKGPKGMPKGPKEMPKAMPESANHRQRPHLSHDDDNPGEQTPATPFGPPLDMQSSSHSSKSSRSSSSSDESNRHQETETPSVAHMTSYPSSAPSVTSVPSASVAPSSSPSVSFAPTVSAAPSSAPSVSLAPSVSSAPSSSPSMTRVPSQTPSMSPSTRPTISFRPSITRQPSSGPTVSFRPSATRYPSAAPSLSKSPSESFPTSTPTVNCQPKDCPRPPRQWDLYVS